jgi:hypothetical protein
MPGMLQGTQAGTHSSHAPRRLRRRQQRGGLRTKLGCMRHIAVNARRCECKSARRVRALATPLGQSKLKNPQLRIYQGPASVTDATCPDLSTFSHGDRELMAKAPSLAADCEPTRRPHPTRHRKPQDACHTRAPCLVPERPHRTPHAACGAPIATCRHRSPRPPQR